MCIAKIAEEYCVTQKQRRKNMEHLNLFVIKNTLSVILKKNNTNFKIIKFTQLILCIFDEIIDLKFSKVSQLDLCHIF